MIGLPHSEHRYDQSSLGNREGRPVQLREESARDEVLITRHGRAGAILIGFADEDDWLDCCLEHDGRFLKRIAESRVMAVYAAMVPPQRAISLIASAFFRPFRRRSTPWQVCQFSLDAGPKRADRTVIQNTMRSSFFMVSDKLDLFLTT